MFMFFSPHPIIATAEKSSLSDPQYLLHKNSFLIEAMSDSTASPSNLDSSQFILAHGIVPSTRFEADGCVKTYPLLSNYGAFEVYKVQRLHITPNRDFKQITLFGDYKSPTMERRYAIYEDGILLGLKEFPISCCRMVMVIGDPEWNWNYYFRSYDEENKVLTVAIVDHDSPDLKPRVGVTYERITYSYQAEISLSFDGNVRITRGDVGGLTICSDDQIRPMLLLGHFLEEEENNFVPNEIIPLHRSYVNIPLKSKFSVQFDLLLAAGKLTVHLKTSCDIDVPHTTGKHVFIFQLAKYFPKLKMEVSWGYDTHGYIDGLVREEATAFQTYYPPVHSPSMEKRIQEWKEKKNCPKKIKKKKNATTV